MTRNDVLTVAIGSGLLFTAGYFVGKQGDYRLADQINALADSAHTLDSTLAANLAAYTPARDTITRTLVLTRVITDSVLASPPAQPTATDSACPAPDLTPFLVWRDSVEAMVKRERAVADSAISLRDNKIARDNVAISMLQRQRDEALTLARRANRGKRFVVGPGVGLTTEGIRPALQVTVRLLSF